MKSLDDFIAILRKNGDLIDIHYPLSVNLEITEVHSRVINSKSSKALLFHNPILHNGSPSSVPILVNLFGSKDRVAGGMGMELNKVREFGEKLAFLKYPKTNLPKAKLTEYADLLKRLASMKPKIVNEGPIHDIILQGKDVDLGQLPIQSCFPHEAAPLVTFGISVTQGPSFLNKEKKPIIEDDYNLGIYRMQVIDKNKLIVRWLNNRGGYLHFLKWKKANPNKDMPMSVVIGADPGTILSAVIPVPDEVSEYKFSGLLRSSRLKIIKGVSNDIYYPANSEIVLEGYVSSNEVAKEGPYADHTGYYNEVEEFPVFHVKAIAMRKKAVYLSTFTARAPDEPAILGEVLNELFIPMLQSQFSDIVDFYLPPETCSYRVAVISVKKTYPGQARRIMMGAWSFLRQFMYTKTIIVVDDDINVRDWSDVMWAVATRSDAARDTMIINNTNIDYLDFASPEPGIGSKIGIDATNKIGNETSRVWGTKIQKDQETSKKIDSIWKELGINI